MSKKAYLSGPMAGREALNEPAFRAVEEYLLRAADTNIYDVVVPHDLPPWKHTGECPVRYRSSSKPGTHTSACYLRVDLQEMLRCDEVWMLPEWESSIGASLELQVATACGIPVRFFMHELAAAWRQAEPEIVRAIKAMEGMGFYLQTQADPEKRTPDEWSRLDNITVLDRDGWNGTFRVHGGLTYVPQEWETPITRREWEHRMSISSVSRKTKPRKGSSIQ